LGTSLDFTNGKKERFTATRFVRVQQFHREIGGVNDDNKQICSFIERNEDLTDLTRKHKPIHPKNQNAVDKDIPKILDVANQTWANWHQNSSSSAPL
jgi:hypothetical protein